MLNAIDVAKYFLSKDLEKKVFTKNLIELNDKTFHDGNARLNKYLHLAQNIYIAKTGKPLLKEDFYAWINGAVIPSIRDNFNVLYEKRNYNIKLDTTTKEFLDKLYSTLKNATIEELIDLSHEDTEWKQKSKGICKSEQKMNSISRRNEYKEQYADILALMERMDADGNY